MHRQRRSAHTMFELLVSVVILGVLLGVVHFSIPRRVPVSSKGIMQTCQRRAIEERRDVSVATGGVFLLCSADGRVAGPDMDWFSIVHGR